MARSKYSINKEQFRFD